MAFSFQVGPPVLGLRWSGSDYGAGAVAGARTQGHPGSRTGTRANVRPGFRAGTRTDATPGTGAGDWARKSGVCVKIRFIDMIVSRLFVFKGVGANFRTTHRVLFNSICTQT